MPERAIDLQFPIGGVSKQFAFQSQPPFTTVSASNVWPTQWSTGRARGATRLGLDSFGSSIGAPQNSCPATWTNAGTTHYGVAVATTGGAYVSTSAGFTGAITDTAGNFCSVAIFNNILFFARGASTCLHRTLTTPGSGAGTVLTATEGTAPTNCGLVSVHGNRLVLFGDTSGANQIYFSRAGEYAKWDYTEQSRAAAVAFSGTGAQIFEPITAGMSHTHGCFLFGTTDSIHVLRGNPASSGASLDTISHEVGPLNNACWTKVNNGWTYMLTRDGLYRYPPGCPEGEPESVSRERLPEELVDINPGLVGHHASIGYDRRWRGLHIYVTKGSTRAYYFYNLMPNYEGFWPMTFSQDLRLAVNHKSRATATESALLAITDGGSVYQFDKASSESFDSVCWYGPVMLWPNYSEGMIYELAATLALDSSNTRWGLYVADSPEEAFDLDSNPNSASMSDATYSGSDWEPGKNFAENPLVSGQAAFLKVACTTTNKFSIDRVTLLTRQLGLERV